MGFVDCGVIMARFMKSLLQDRIRERRDPSREPKRVRAAERSILLHTKKKPLVATDYFTKWVEAEPMTEVTTTERETELSQKVIPSC